jgi:uncharacterized membrane protein YraQ (UPF0718 family)
MNPSSSLASPVLAAIVRKLRRQRALGLLAAMLVVLAAAAPDQFGSSLAFVGRALLSLAPVLALSVALAAGTRAAGAEVLVARAFVGRVHGAIVIAALAGALSPLCSCGVVPLIAGLLAGGVPLAPVMAFWLASPVMDPAMFVLTAGVIGTEFALAKTVAAIALGLAGGWVTRLLWGADGPAHALRVERAARALHGPQAWAAARLSFDPRFWREAGRRQLFMAGVGEQLRLLLPLMAIAFLLESLMLAWMPPQAFAQWLGGQTSWAIPAAALIGVPAYLNGSAAVPLAGALIQQGLDPAVAMTFLVAGGVTSVPAALAVWALVRPKVFALYLGLALAGSMAAGALLAASGWLA